MYTSIPNSTGGRGSYQDLILWAISFTELYLSASEEAQPGKKSQQAVKFTAVWLGYSGYCWFVWSASGSLVYMAIIWVSFALLSFVFTVLFACAFVYQRFNYIKICILTHHSFFSKENHWLENHEYKKKFFIGRRAGIVKSRVSAPPFLVMWLRHPSILSELQFPHVQAVGFNAHLLVLLWELDTRRVKNT